MSLSNLPTGNGSKAKYDKSIKSNTVGSYLSVVADIYPSGLFIIKYIYSLYITSSPLNNISSFSVST